MALKRIERKPLKESGGLKEMEVGGIAKRRLLNSALDFVQNEEDVLADLPEDLSPEEAHVARMERLDDALNQKTTIKADLKRQGEAHKEQGRTDYHFVVCFADKIDNVSTTITAAPAKIISRARHDFVRSQTGQTHAM